MGESSQAVNLEQAKQSMENLLKFLYKGNPNMIKIKATPFEHQKTLVKEAIAIMRNDELAMTIMDDKKKKRICHAVKGILENASQADVDLPSLKEALDDIIIRRAHALGKKRKPTNQHNFSTSDSFNAAAKIQKTFMPEDTAIPDKWLKWTSSLREPVVFINSTDENGAIELKDKIELNKINMKITAEITSLRASGDKILTKLTNSAQEKLFIQEVKNLFPEVEPYVPELLDPMIMLLRVPQSVETDEFIRDLRKFNNFNSDDKIIFHKSFPAAGTASKNVVLRVSPAIREELEIRRGRLLYKCTTLKAVDYFTLIKCNRCLRFSHLRTECASQSVCKICADYHRTEFCPNKLNTAKFKCASCGKEGHRAVDKKECEEYLKQLRYYVSITNYAYNYIILD